MQGDSEPTGKRREDGEDAPDDAAVRARIAELLDAEPVDGRAAEAPRAPRAHGRSHGHGHGHGHRSRHGSHRHKQRLTPRSAKLQWWHLLLILVVGLAVTWVVISIASGPAGPPPE